jgi:hypothetical protein
VTHEHPFPGQALRRVEHWNNYEEIDEDILPVGSDLEEANIITSEIALRDGSRHKVLLDIDMPVKILPSSTEGHFHLFIDKELGTKEYFKLIKAFVKAGIVEEGYLSASAERGYTAVRVPWVPKLIARCVGCDRVPDEIDEYIEAAKDEGLRHPSQFVRRNEGTYNPDNGHFYCTKCYIKAGQPLGVAP